MSGAIIANQGNEPGPRTDLYHQACDTISNVNFTGLDQLADGAAHAVAVYAYARSG